jgi:acetaldehyde dehydrogenase / alcohol dehydrogenase
VKVEKPKDLELLIDKVKVAQNKFVTFNQEQVDRIFKQAAMAADSASISLAKMAQEETGMGIIEDKAIKNKFASENVYNRYKDEKTCGVIESDPEFGIKKIAEPVGLIAGIVPTNNPTSTTIFKALLALKTRNGIIFSPHPRAKKCTVEAAKIVLEAAVEAGAPPDIIGWIDEPTVELSKQLMQHPEINLIVATGGAGMVHAAYSSGHPSLGVGAGNTPAVIDETADIQMAVSSIILSKTFDNGMICASEQAVIVLEEVYDPLKQEFIKRGAHFLTPEEREKIGTIILQEGHLNPSTVGQSVEKLEQLAGIEKVTGAKLLIGEVEEIGTNEPFSYEKLSPILAMYRANDFQDAVEKAKQIVNFGGKGHTSVLYTAPENQERINYFESQMQTSRVLINTPSSQGAIGDLYNFKLQPSLTLGCGTWGGNTISENVSPRHLLNIKTVCDRRENMLWFRVPPKIYFKYGCLPVALKELKDKKRVSIISDQGVLDAGLIEEVTDIFRNIGVQYDIFCEVEPEPKLSTINKGVAALNVYQPDAIVAFGGGSVIDAAKVMWLIYEHPEVDFQGTAMRFIDISLRISELPSLGEKAFFVAIPTTSGTGSEVTPFAVITDDFHRIKYPLADYALTPNMAIIDPQLALHLPKTLTAYGGIDALTHAIEAYVSIMATEFTNGLALNAIALLFKYLPRAYHNGAKDIEAREKVHYAATIAGMAFANAFLGICHSLAHKLGSTFNLPHGLANALMISHTIRYNATDAPFKQAIFPQYKYPLAKERYAEIADYLHLGGEIPEEKVEKLIQTVEQLKRQLDIPMTIKEALPGDEKEFYENLEEMALQAFEDRCTETNPRYPLIWDLRELYVLAFQGCRIDAATYHLST